MKSKSIIAYNNEFEDILEIYSIIKIDNKESSNQRKILILVRNNHILIQSKENEIKWIWVIIQYSSNKNSVLFSIFLRIFPINRVDIYNILKK